MSNQIVIQPTKFENVRNSDTSYGCRIYDNYSNCYMNNWDSIPDDDMDVFDIVCEHIKNYQGDDANNDILVGFIDYINENKCTVYIGDVAYSYEKLKPILEKHNLA